MKFEFDSVNTLIKPVLDPVICYNVSIALIGYFTNAFLDTRFIQCYWVVIQLYWLQTIN